MKPTRPQKPRKLLGYANGVLKCNNGHESFRRDINLDQITTKCAICGDVTKILSGLTKG